LQESVTTHATSDSGTVPIDSKRRIGSTALDAIQACLNAFYINDMRSDQIMK